MSKTPKATAKEMAETIQCWIRSYYRRSEKTKIDLWEELKRVEGEVCSIATKQVLAEILDIMHKEAFGYSETKEIDILGAEYLDDENFYQNKM